jgi:replicative DNA helicase
VALTSRKRSGEALLISTMLNTGLDPAAYGITEEMLTSHAPHFRWLRAYPTQYAQAPSVSAFQTAFPQFNVDTSTSDLLFACDMVRREHRKRQMVRLLTSATEAVADGDVDDAIRQVQSASFVMGHNRPVNILDDETFLDDYAEKPDSMSFPWKTLQRETGGIRKGDLTYIAARMGNGKSWLLADIARHSLLEGRDVKIYSLEMPKAQVTVRMHVLLGQSLGMDVDHIAMRDRVFDVSAYRHLLQAIKANVAGKLYIHDLSDGRVSPYTLTQDGEIDLICVDYIGLMDSPVAGGKAIDDWRTLGAISHGLKEIAVSKDGRVLAASQINREGVTVGLTTPKVKNLSQSDVLGQDGDLIITHKQAGTVMAASIEKNRSGATGEKFYLRFLPNKGEFPEIGRDKAEQIHYSEAED